MGQLNGMINLVGIGGEFLNPNISSDINRFSIDYIYTPSIQERNIGWTCGFRNYVLASALGRSINAQISTIYMDDFYYRIHIKPSSLNLGSMVSSEIRKIYIWNAFFENKTLNSITKENAEGINITPEIAPIDYMPLEEKVYEVSISLDGPPIIDASINFAFTVYTLELSITGSKVTLWVWIPKQEYTEVLEWNTEILNTRLGEQRLAYRDAPRQRFDFNFIKSPQQISKIKIAADNWGYREWAVPIWKESTSAINAVAGNTAINFSTAYKDYRNGGLAVIWESEEKAEAMRVVTVRTNGIDIYPGLMNSYSNALIMPLRKAIMLDGINFSRGQTGEWTQFSTSFLVTDNINLTSLRMVTAWEVGIAIVAGQFYSPGNNFIYSVDKTGTAGTISQWPTTIGNTVKDSNNITYTCVDYGYPQYLGYDVLTDGNVIIGDMAERIYRPVVMIDNGQGPVVVESMQDYTNFSKTIGKFTKTLYELWMWRKWLHSRYGKQKAFWLPSWNQDLILTDTIYATDTQLKILPLDLYIHGNFPFVFMLKLKDGSIFFRKAMSTENIIGGERITIDKSFGRTIMVSDIKMCCFMDLVRFNSDQIELKHKNPYIMQNTIPVMRVQDEF